MPSICDPYGSKAYSEIIQREKAAHIRDYMTGRMPSSQRTQQALGTYIIDPITGALEPCQPPPILKAVPGRPHAHLTVIPINYKTSLIATQQLGIEGDGSLGSSSSSSSRRILHLQRQLSGSGSVSSDTTQMENRVRELEDSLREEQEGRARVQRQMHRLEELISRQELASKQKSTTLLRGSNGHQ
eukprot:Tbor_TRINITY_DN5559_c2_g1::TRINITY_DN5559_c2_g1_i1::g.13200::m.13200